MANPIPITQYEITYSSNSFSPRIGLQNAPNHFVGQLVFHPNGAPLPQDAVVNGIANLHYHLDDFANVLEVLRGPKPVFLVFNGVGPGFENAIQTGLIN